MDPNQLHPLQPISTKLSTARPIHTDATDKYLTCAPQIGGNDVARMKVENGADSMMDQIQRMNVVGDDDKGPVEGESDQEKAVRQQRLKHRMNLFVFVQVLLKYLAKVDRDLSFLCKEVLQECSKKNKAGDPAYRSLAMSIQLQLRKTVGETHWARVEQIQRVAQMRAQRKREQNRAKLKK